MSFIKFAIIVAWGIVLAVALVNGAFWAFSAAHPDQWTQVSVSAGVVAVAAITLYGLLEKDY